MWKMLIIIASMGFFWCLAESFLVPDKAERRKTPSQLKQDIADSLGTLLEKKIELVQTITHIQQVLCKQIRAIAENDRNSEYKNAKVRELQSRLAHIRQENERCEKELALEKRFLSALNANITQ